MNKNKHAGINYKIYVILFLYFILYTYEVEIKAKNNNFTYDVYKNDKLQELFIYRNHFDICDCSPKSIFYELPDNNNTEFYFNFQGKNDEKFFLEKIWVQSSNPLIKLNFKNKTNNNNPESNFNNSIEMDIETQCMDTNINDYQKYWGVLEVEIFYNINKKIRFEYIKFCKTPELMGSILTACLLFLMSTVFVAVSTYSEITIELTEIKQEGEIKYYHGLILILTGSIVLVLIFYFVEYINVIFTIVITFQSGLALYLSLKTFYEKLNFHSNQKLRLLNSQINLKFCTIEMYSLILICCTVFIVLLYLITRHWVLNNILGFCLVFTILSIFHIRSLKICAILLISAFLYDVFWVYISPFIFSQNVMVVAATSLNLPIKLEIPIMFLNHPLKSCMFLGLGDLVLPGFVIKFCRRFDFLKNTNKYYIFSLLLYVLALTMSGLVIAIFNYPQPVLFYMCPTLLIGLNYLANKRKEMDIWHADLLEDNLHLIRNENGISQIKIDRDQYNIANIIENYSDLENKNDISFTETQDSNSSDEK